MAEPNRAGDWLRQAGNDLEWAADTLRSERFAQACFVCQQAAEKALKAVAFARGFDRVRGHSIPKVAKAPGINDEVEKAARRLDLHHMTTRHPDALPSGAPFEYFDRSQAEEALQLAALVIERARKELAA